MPYTKAQSTHLHKGKLDGLANLLLLLVEATDVRVLDVGALVSAKHRDRRVSLGGKNVDERVGVTVEGNRGRGLQELAVEGGQDAHNIVGA